MQENIVKENSLNSPIKSDELSLIVGAYLYSLQEDKNFIPKQLLQIFPNLKNKNCLLNKNSIEQEVNNYFEAGYKKYFNHLLFLKEQNIDDLIDFFYNDFKDYKNQISFYVFYSKYKLGEDVNLNNEFRIIFDNVASLVCKNTDLKFHHRWVGMIFLNLFHKIAEGNIINSLGGKSPIIPNKNFILNIIKDLEYKPE